MATRSTEAWAALPKTASSGIPLWVRSSCAANLVLVPAERLSGVLGKKDLAGNVPALAFHIEQVLAAILIQIKGKQLGNPQGRMQEHEKDRVVADRVLVPAAFELEQLFGGRLQSNDFEVRQALPFGRFGMQVMHAGTWMSGQERPLAVNPAGAVAKRGQRPIDRRRANSAVALQVFDVRGGQRAGPEVEFVRAGCGGEEVKKATEVSPLRGYRVVRAAGRFQLHVEVAPSDQRLAALANPKSFRKRYAW